MENASDDFDTTWAAISGVGPRRTTVNADLSFDVSDGRDLAVRLKEIATLLESHGVIISALGPTDVAASPSGATEMKFIATHTTRTDVAGQTGQAHAEMGATFQIIQALMLTPEYERLLTMSLSTDEAGRESVAEARGRELVSLLTTTARDAGWGDPPPLVVPPRLALAIHRYFDASAARFEAIGYDRISNGTQFQCLRTLDVPR